MNEKKQKTLVLHPFLIGIYPILFLYSYNISQVSLRALMLPVVLTLAVTFLFWISLGYVIKDFKKSGIIASMGLAIFFSFGHIASYLCLIIPPAIFRYRYMIGLTALIFASVVYLTIRAKRDLGKLTNALNYLAAFLVLMTLIQISAYHLKRSPVQVMQKGEIPKVSKLKDKSLMPDIYYFIFDGYGNRQSIMRYHDFDNREFLDGLRKRGFFVAERSRSNYNQTFTSISSSLNMEYLDQISSKMGEYSEDLKPFYSMIQDNKVMLFLKSLGYKYINFSSGWEPTSYNPNADRNIGHLKNMNEFSMILAKTTLLKIFETDIIRRFTGFMHRRKQSMILSKFEEMSEVTRMEGPKFVMMHILVPHAPFVFNEDGSLQNITSFDFGDWASRDGYVKEMRFINKKIETMVDEIIANSKIPPVIIMQGDHGPRWTWHSNWRGDPHGWRFEDIKEDTIIESTGILNVYLISKECQKNLYDWITPVNSFRVVLNCYFGTSYRMLPDNIYWSMRYTPYKLVDITKRSRKADGALKYPR